MRLLDAQIEANDTAARWHAQQANNLQARADYHVREAARLSRDLVDLRDARWRLGRRVVAIAVTSGGQALIPEQAQR